MPTLRQDLIAAASNHFGISKGRSRPGPTDVREWLETEAAPVRIGARHGYEDREALLEAVNGMDWTRFHSAVHTASEKVFTRNRWLRALRGEPTGNPHDDGTIVLTKKHRDGI
jgi:hypothetical protein